MDPTSIYSIPSLAIEHVWEVRPIDVNNTFLHGQLHMQVLWKNTCFH